MNVGFKKHGLQSEERPPFSHVATRVGSKVVAPHFNSGFTASHLRDRGKFMQRSVCFIPCKVGVVTVPNSWRCCAGSMRQHVCSAEDWASEIGHAQ